MLNLDMFGRGNQPAIDKLPTLNERGDEDSASGRESWDSQYDKSTDHDESSKSTGNEMSSTTDLSTAMRSDTGSSHAIGARESKNICRLRCSVFFVLLLSTVLLAVIVKNSASRNEYERFEAQFSEHASKIVDSLVNNLEHGIGEVDNLAVSITSYTGSVNTPWPYAFIPEFEIRAASTRKLANAALISLVPLVEEPQRQDWE
jgi:hypothetical protein